MSGVAQRGTAALAVTWWGLAMLALALAAVAGGVDLAATQARARTAADAAALAGAGAHPLAGGDGDICRAAASLAGANGARLVSCGVSGRAPTQLRVAVRVATEPATAALGDALGPVGASATAGLTRVTPPAASTATSRPRRPRPHRGASTATARPRWPRRPSRRDIRCVEPAETGTASPAV